MYIYIQSLSTTSSVMIAVLISSILCTKFCYQDNWDTTVHLPAVIFVLSLVQVSMIGLIGTNIDSVTGYSDITNFKIILAVCGALSSVPIFFGLYRIYKYLRPTAAEKARAKHQTDIDITQQRLSQQQQLNEYYQLNQLAKQYEVDYKEQKENLSKNAAISEQDRERRLEALERQKIVNIDELALRKQQLKNKDTQEQEIRKQELKLQKQKEEAANLAKSRDREESNRIQNLFLEMQQVQQDLIEEKRRKEEQLKVAKYKQDTQEEQDRIRSDIRSLDSELGTHNKLLEKVAGKLAGQSVLNQPDIEEDRVKQEKKSQGVQDQVKAEFKNQPPQPNPYTGQTYASLPPGSSAAEPSGPSAAAERTALPPGKRGAAAGAEPSGASALEKKTSPLDSSPLPVVPTVAQLADPHGYSQPIPLNLSPRPESNASSPLVPLSPVQQSSVPIAQRLSSGPPHLEPATQESQNSEQKYPHVPQLQIVTAAQNPEHTFVPGTPQSSRSPVPGTPQSSRSPVPIQDVRTRLTRP
jgi:hypothetical protein